MRKFLFIAIATVLLSGTPQPANACISKVVAKVKSAAVVVKNDTVKVVKYLGQEIKDAAHDVPKDVIEAIAVLELVPIILLAL
jgi:hypothetical protein